MLAYSLENLYSAVSTIKFFGTFAVVLAILISLFRLLFLPRIKGWLGERKVSGALRCLNRKVYRVFDDLYLPRPDGQGTTQVDHVVVSCFGIFVIEELPRLDLWQCEAKEVDADDLSEEE